MSKKLYQGLGVIGLFLLLFLVINISHICEASSTFSSNNLPTEIIDQDEADLYLNDGFSDDLKKINETNRQSENSEGDFIEGTYRSINESDIDDDVKLSKFDNNLLNNSKNSNIIDYQKDVTSEMCNPDYFIDRSTNPDRVLKTASQIDQINRDILADKKTKTNDFTTPFDSFNGNNMKESVKDDAVNCLKDIFKINLKNIDASDMIDYINKMSFNISNAETMDSMDVTYAVTIHNSSLKVCPTDDYLTWEDCDNLDANQNTGICVNEPFAIYFYTSDKKFAWGCSECYFGWINVDDIALCKNREECLNSCVMNTDSKDFIVVTADKIFLEESMFEKSTSGLLLTMGTTLKLVQKSEIPETIDDYRCT